MLNVDATTINLLLTRRCNFQCDHCMYSASPKLPGAYMSNEVLDAARRQAEVLWRNEIAVTVNLIGGEPTLNMDEFKRCLDHVMRWATSVEMTTNGWWLEKDDDIRRFLKIVSPYVNGDGDGDGFAVRISNDPYHDVFRSPDLQSTDALRRRVYQIWESGILDRTKYCVQPAGGWLVITVIIAPDAGEKLEEQFEELVDFYIPEPDPEAPWLYVDSPITPDQVRPMGRGFYVAYGDPKYCSPDYLSYLPDGRLMDICCGGSWCEFGTIFDDPMTLLKLNDKFIQETEPTCSGCREAARHWKRLRLKQAKQELEVENEDLSLEMEVYA